MVEATKPRAAPIKGEDGGTITASLVFERPSLARARSFGKDCRPHRIPDPAHASGYRLARIGEVADPVSNAKAEPYTLLSTPLSSFDEFGIGVSLYFRQLIFLAVLFFISGLIYIPSIYNNWKSNPAGTPITLKGSAFGADRSDLKFGLTGMTDFVVCVFLLIFSTVSQRVEDAVATHIDLAQQTPQDYAVCVKNPDRELRDADAYYRFFSKFGEVVFVSMALDNGNLLRTMAKKRVVELEMSASVEGQSLLSSGIDQDVADKKHLWLYHRILHKLGIKRRAQYLQEERRKLLRKIQDLTKVPSRVKRVFIIYNNEHAQRACLQRMRTGLIHRWFNVDVPTEQNSPEGIFQGRRLRVFEPVEPSEVHWENFNIKMWFRIWRMCVAFFITGCFLYISYRLLYSVRDKRGIWSGLIVSAVNVLLPQLMKFLTNHIEIHLDQSDLQDSILTKLVLARCLNTAVMKYLVTEYETAFSADTLNSIMFILIADCVTTPLLNLLNIPDRLRRWFLAPRAKTQQQMDLFFLGTPWNLAERYTDMIKTIFVGLFYSSVMPVLPFITSIAMVVIFWTDKYNILYQWRRPPAIDGTLAGRSRNFLSISVFVHVIMARTFFANWPYVNKGEQPKCGFLVCLPRSFFTQDQLHLVGFYNILGFITMGIVCWTYLYNVIFMVFGRFLGWVNEVGDATDIEFRSLIATEAYVPLIRSKHFSDPLLACDVSNMPSAFLPIHEQRTASVVDINRLCLCSSHDLPFITDPAERAKLFGSVTFYPPPPSAPAPVFGIPVTLPPAAPQPPLSPRDSLPNIPGLQGVFNIAQGILAPTQLAEEIDPTTVAPLPVDWQEVTDDDGNVYYMNTESGATQWERPVAGAGPGLTPQPGQFTGDSTSPYRLGQSRRTPPPFRFATE